MRAHMGVLWKLGIDGQRIAAAGKDFITGECHEAKS